MTLDHETRDQRRKHIQSAIDWLEKADESLAAEQDIKSDLNLMLAKAELQHEKENRKDSAILTITKTLITKAGTFIVAGLIAAIIFYYPKTDQVYEKIESEVENTIAIDAAENEVPRPVEQREIKIDPIEEPREEENLAEKIKVEKIELETIYTIDEEPPIEYNRVEYKEDRIEQRITPPDNNLNVTNEIPINDLVTSAEIILRSK